MVEGRREGRGKCRVEGRAECMVEGRVRLGRVPYPPQPNPNPTQPTLPHLHPYTHLNHTLPHFYITLPF